MSIYFVIIVSAVSVATGLNGYNKDHIIIHTVVKNDSLWAIAEKYLGNVIMYHEIKALNGLKSDTIHLLRLANGNFYKNLIIL